MASTLVTIRAHPILWRTAESLERAVDQPMENITRLLGLVRAGDTDARSALFGQVYAQLMRIAQARLAGNQVRFLDAPSLVHEAYLRLSEQKLISLQDRRDFFAYAAAVMRNVVVDYVRHQRAQKRGAGATEVTLSGADAQIDGISPDVEELHSALERLAQVDQRAYRVIEMRYFAGLSMEEIAQVLEVSTGTVNRSWRSGRAFLFESLR
jgi:RNA polymerase sigma factor (TIGR02999 family)